MGLAISGAIEKAQAELIENMLKCLDLHDTNAIVKGSSKTSPNYHVHPEFTVPGGDDYRNEQGDRNSAMRLTRHNCFTTG